MRSPWETATRKNRGGLAAVVLRQGRSGPCARGAGQLWTWAALLCAVSLYWLTPRSAHAQVAPAWQLRFTAPPACATEEAFRKALNDRALRSEAFPRALEHRIVVSILPADGGWNGWLVVESPADGVRVERTARATHCDELVPALALMTALALDLEPLSAPEPPSPRTIPQTGSLFSSPLLPASPTVVPVRPLPPKAIPRRTEGELGFLVHWRSVVGWRDRAAVAPSVLWGSRTVEGFSPWVRVSAAHVATQIADASGFGASLTWTIAQLDGCTHKWALWGRAFVSPCARLSIGALNAKGRAGVRTPHDRTRLWLTAGGGVEVAIPIVGPLWLRVQGGIEALVLRQRVYVDMDRDHTLVQMPPGLGLFGVGLGVRIW